MTQYDNTNSGVLFKNKDKTTDKHPDYTGKIDVDGREMRLAAWIREGKNGKFMSLKLSEFQQRAEVGNAPMRDVMDGDDVPF
jgi:uncharacterized protein (DUF736 family)